MRLTRSGMLEVLSADYIRTAYAKGLRPLRVLFKHDGMHICSSPGAIVIGTGPMIVVSFISENLARRVRCL